jgi:hypothetical protein
MRDKMKTQKRKRLCPLPVFLSLLALTVTAISAPALAAPKRADKLAARAQIREMALKTTSIAASFTQTKHLSLFNQPVLSEGKFLFAKPDRLRWELTKPITTGFALSGGKGVRWHELTGKPEKFDAATDPIMSAVANQLIAWATGDFDSLEELYRVEAASLTPPRYNLWPLSEAIAGFIEMVEVEFAPNSEHVERVDIFEPGGDFTSLIFLDVVKNGKVNEEDFTRP